MDGIVVREAARAEFESGKCGDVGLAAYGPHAVHRQPHFLGARGKVAARGREHSLAQYREILGCRRVAHGAVGIDASTRAITHHHERPREVGELGHTLRVLGTEAGE